MSGIVLGVVASTILALVFRRRPVVWVSIGLLLAVLLPTVVTRTVFIEAGPLASIHPATWVFGSGLVVTTVFSPPVLAVTRLRRALVVCLILWVGIAGLVVVESTGAGALDVFALYYVTPTIVFLAINAACVRQDPRLWHKLVPVVLAIASIETALAIVQYLAHSSLVFGQYYATNYWWKAYFDRALGTFDSPLDLAAFLSMVIPFTAALRRTPLVFMLAGFFAVGIVVTGSRTGIVLAVLAIVWVVLVRSTNVVTAVLSSAAIGLITVAFLASPLVTTLLDRFGSRGDISTEVRSDALVIGIDLAREDLLSGHGLGYAYTYSSTVLRSSFENAYLATAIDLGLFVTLGLLAIQLWAVWSGRGASLLSRLPGLLAVIWGFLYSSFVSTSTFGITSWLFIALASIAGFSAAGRRSRGPARTPGDTGRRPAGARRLMIGSRIDAS